MKKHLIFKQIVWIVLCLPFCIQGITAQTAQREQSVTVHLANASLQEVFSAIEKQTTYRFSYRDVVVDNRKDITVERDNAPVGAVLNDVLRGRNLEFNIVSDRSIVIFDRRPANSREPNQRPVKRIIGEVVDNAGEPVVGATVLEKGTASNGTITDLDGKFTLTVQNNATLQISYVGYITQEISIATVNEGRPLSVKLLEDTQALEEVVVIGYGTQRKGDVTSSIGSVSKEKFTQGAVRDAGQLIQGQVAGLTITNPSGNPVGNTQILLRGNTTILGASTNPLILIDGVPGDFNTVAPEDIESVDVLKDGSAAAIYGSRGTNGVIMVTTKKAKGENINEVEYSGYLSTSRIVKRLEMLDAEDYRNQIRSGVRDAAWDLGTTTDWLDEATRVPLSHVHNLTLNGGNSQTNYILNMNYRLQEGIFKKSDRNTFQGRAEINHYMFDNKLKINAGIIGNETGYTSTTGGGSFNTYIYRQTLIHNPTEPVTNADGSWTEQPGIFEYANPMSLLYESEGQQEITQLRINGNITFTPIKSLVFNALLSYDKSNQYGGIYETKSHISSIRDGLNGYAYLGSNSSMTKLAELTARYSLEMEGHSASLLGGYSYQGTDYSSMSQSNYDFPTDVYSYNNIGSGNALKEGLASMSSYRLKTNLISFFGRLSYSYKNRYLLLASLRHEAASQLAGTKQPWGTFPSVSLGWRITEESFMQGQTFFNDVKLRAGYGVTGSQPSNSFLGMSLLSYGAYSYSNGKWIRILQPSQNPNPSLRWEEKRETNLGLDFSILDSRIGGSLDLYNREINGLLYDYNVPSPPNVYTSTRANVGVMSNKGFEAMLNFVPVKTKDLQWNATITFSTNTNKLESLSNDLYQASSDYFMTGWIQEPVKVESHIVKIGQPIGDFYGYKVIDIGDDGKWIYEDRNGNAVPFDEFSHSFEDKQVIGNGLPKYYLGFNNNLRYRDFDMSITMRGAFGYQILNCARMFYENNSRQDWNRLKSSQDIIFGKQQLASSVPQEYNSYYIEDGDHWKIDNITIGYTISNTGIKYLKSARLYVSSLNTLTITGYKGTDPEVSRSGLNPGYDDRDQYPNIRSFTFGVNVKF